MHHLFRATQHLPTTKKPHRYFDKAFFCGVEDGVRTHDTRNHNPVLLPTELYPPHGTPKGIRTPDLLLRRQLLYPAELLAHIGAGDGNRTHTTSLEGWDSTIELHPHGC